MFARENDQTPKRMTRHYWCHVMLATSAIITIVIMSLSFKLVYPWRRITPFDDRLCEKTTSPIPKVVHRLWDGQISEKYASYLHACKMLSPNYELRLWNTSAIETFLKTQYPWFMKFYYQYPKNIERYDAARYFIILHFGGIYLDMDMNCSKSFDSIITSTSRNYDVILGQAFPVGIVNNFFIAKQNSQFFTQVIHNLANTREETFIIPLYETFMKTGPVFLWKNYLNFPCTDQIYVLDKFKIRDEWLTHDGAASWQSDSGQLFMFLSNSWAASFSIYNSLIILMVILAIIALFVRLFC